MGSNFFVCGIIGWCLEIIWTACGSIKKGNTRLMGTTSIIMFPIYGMAATIGPVWRKIKNLNMFVRGTIYTCAIFTTEYITGRYLKNKGICPWDYSKSKYNINGIIRLDYAPVWFTTGLLYEAVLRTIKKKSV